MGQIEQVNNVEQKIDRTLSNMWLDAIWMRDQLGEEHELYNDFHKLMGDINHVQSLSSSLPRLFHSISYILLYLSSFPLPLFPCRILVHFSKTAFVL